MSKYLLAIDQGTTSTRAMIFSKSGEIISQDQQEFRQYFPYPGWVEHDPEEIWQSVLHTVRGALKNGQVQASDIMAVGISNQRETTVLWDKQNGRALYPAIVWQDRRTADYCFQLARAGDSARIADKTGLLLDPYFSASKIVWILNHVPEARERAERGEIAFGTIDSYLLWRLTKGSNHATDVTNAARTLLFDIHRLEWDDELLDLFQIPKKILPAVFDCCADFGICDAEWFGDEIPITGIAGDQQAAAFGQACVEPGMMKSTYGTGCFLLCNTGEKIVKSKHRLLSTVAYRINGKTAYALEGSIFVAGAAIQWLRDAIKLISSAKETEAIARMTEDTGGVYLVPAFTGLGAPYWDPEARGAIVGLTRDSGINQIVRAALEAVAYQTRDLLEAMLADGIQTLATLRIDGGMVANTWFAQFLADILHIPIQCPVVTETSALGAAYLAGLGSHLFQSIDEIAKLWRHKAEFQPKMDEKKRADLYQGWKNAVHRILST